MQPQRLSPAERRALQAFVYFVVLVFLVGIIGAVVQLIVSTSGLVVSPNLDLRIGLVLGALAGAALFAVALYAEPLRCPICKTRNMLAPR